MWLGLLLLTFTLSSKGISVDSFEGDVLSRWVKEEHHGGRCVLEVERREKREGEQSLKMRFHLPSGWVIAVREFEPPLKLSPCGALSIWVWSDKPQRFAILSVDPGFDTTFDPKMGYIRWQRKLDWSGWKRLYLPFSDFSGKVGPELSERVAPGLRGRNWRGRTNAIWAIS